MKIRQGFVSNSSSSSFLIYGLALDESEVIAALFPDALENEIDGDLYEATEILGDKGLDAHNPPYSERVYVGLSPTDIGDNETGGEFKRRVVALLKDAGLKGSLKECGWHQDAWRDG